MKHARRVDDNQAEIIEALRTIGVGVVVTSSYEKFCDIVCFYRGQTYLAEIKNGAKDASHQRLTQDQEQLHGLALRHGVVIPVFTSADLALLFFGGHRQ